MTRQKNKDRQFLAKPSAAAAEARIPPASSRLPILLSAGLILLTVLVYAPVWNHDFVSLDDPIYVSDNPHIAKGLTGSGIIWAFTTGRAGNWHPLTWLSHMADIQIHGIRAGGHLVTNLLIHIASSLLLFWILSRATGALGPSVAVAALFAVHPAHVESVAWVAERKDVLSGFFWMLTLAAYSQYVRQNSTKFYLLTILSYALGLMAKPMLVTLPFVLLLLDVWPFSRIPLRHVTSSAAFRLVREKVPLFALAAASSIVTFLAQREGGTVQGLEVIPLATRVANALTSYTSYIGMLVWPHKLAVYYPYVYVIPAGRLVLSAIILIGVSILVIKMANPYPYLVAGWFWFVGTLIPVIGLIQVGEQALADRYTYLPSIGLFIMVCWGAVDLAQRRQGVALLPVVAAVAIALLAFSAHGQVQYWNNGSTLWEHTLAVTTENYMAHNQMAYHLWKSGKRPEAVAQFDEALRIKPNFGLAHFNLGVVLSEQGLTDKAIGHLRQSLQFLGPSDAAARDSAKIALIQAHHKMASELAARNDFDGAIVHLNEVLRMTPSPEERSNLGFVLTAKGDTDAAISHFREALDAQPALYNARYGLALALEKQGRFSEAIQECAEALRLKPDYVPAQRKLAELERSRGNAKKP